MPDEPCLEDEARDGQKQTRSVFGLLSPLIHRGAEVFKRPTITGGRSRGVSVEPLQLVVLAVVRGITEFLPIGSSGHLVALTWLTGWADRGPTFDVAVDVGMLVAVAVYLRAELWAVLRGLTRILAGRADPGARLFARLAVAAIPLGIAGLLIEPIVGVLRAPATVAWASVGFAVLLYAADRLGLTIRRIEHVTAGSAMGIGLMQICALIPGASQTGVAMTAARALGMERREAARFALLLSIPAIAGAGAVKGYDLAGAGAVQLQIDALVAAALACVAALVAIGLMMNWLRRATLAPFVVYRLVTGLAMLGWIYLV